MSNYLKITILIFFLLSIKLSIASSYDGPKLGEPIYTAVDRKHVNMVNGMISYAIKDVSIGHGNLSLTHTISINANDVLNLDSYNPGYKDKFYGGIRRSLYSKSSNGFSTFEVISVFDHESSYNFEIMTNGELKELRDIPVSLEKIDSQTFQLTKEDGTLVKYRMQNTIPSTISQSYAPFGYMKEIIRPDGFTITIHKEGHYLSSPIKSVTTNNGLQLKYIYNVHNRPLEASKQSATNNSNIHANSLEWSTKHPVKIVALNNAVEICPLLTDTCDISNTWPTAYYNWPDGMPRAFFIGNSVFSVTDYLGRTSVFHHKALSKGFQYGDSGTNILPNLNDEYFPRIVKISKPNGFEVTYGYKNYASVEASAPFTWLEYRDHGILNRATLNSKTTTYAFGPERTTYGYSQSNMYTSFAIGDTYQGITSVVSGYKVHSNTAKISTGPTQIKSWDKNVFLSNDLNNQVEKIENKLNGVKISYSYDSKGRLEQISKDGVLTDLSYPSSYCSPKNCNKPSSISSNYNNFLGVFPEYTYTRYQYASGLPQTTTYPANKHNKIKKVQYTSQSYTARYKNSGGKIVNSPSTINLISSEFFCRASNMSGSNVCENGDKITTTYHYGFGNQSNNLFLIGESVSAEDDPDVYTTCYRYNIYGNRIGVSLPESGITDCNVGREY